MGNNIPASLLISLSYHEQVHEMTTLFREILFPSEGLMMREVSPNVASLNILFHDLINLLY